MLESYRNELELFNLQCWALTANPSSTPPSGSGCTTTSATPATTNSSTWNDWAQDVKVKTAKGAILAQSRQPLIVDEFTCPTTRRRPGSGQDSTTPRFAARS